MALKTYDETLSEQGGGLLTYEESEAKLGLSGPLRRDPFASLGEEASFEQDRLASSPSRASFGIPEKPQRSGFVGRTLKGLFNTVVAGPVKAQIDRFTGGRKVGVMRAFLDLSVEDFISRAEQGPISPRERRAFLSPKRVAEDPRLQAIKERVDAGETAVLAESSITRKQRHESLLVQAKQVQAEQANFSFQMQEAEGITDRAADIIAGVSGFVAQLALLRKAFPSTPVAVLWEAQNQAVGGAPGRGLVAFGALAGAGKLVSPLKGAAGVVAKPVAEGVSLGGLTAAEGGSAEDILTSALLPVGLRAAGAAGKGVRKLREQRRVDIAAEAGRQRVQITPQRSGVLPEGSDAPLTQLAQKYVDWSKGVKLVSQEAAEASRKALRKRQAAGGIAAVEAGGLGAVKKGFKGPGEVVTFEPLPLNKAEMATIERAIKKTYPVKGKHIKVFQASDAQDAFRSLRKGVNPTDSGWAHIEKVLGSDVASQLHKKVASTPFTLGKGLHFLADAAKLFVTFDVQIGRQAAPISGRRPGVFIKNVGRGVGAYASKGFAERLNKRTEGRELFSDGKESGLNFLSAGRFSKDRAEWRRAGINNWLAELGQDAGPVKRRLLKPVRGIGKLALASERSFAASMNSTMMDLWELSMRDLQKQGFTGKALVKAKVDRADAINNTLRMFRFKDPAGQNIQKAAGYVLFSPGVTFSRPAQIANVLNKPGSRRFAAEMVASNVAKMVAIGSMGDLVRKHFTGEDGDSANPLSSDFGKVRIENDRKDIHGGDASFYTLMARLAVAAYSNLREKRTEVPVTRVGGQTVKNPGEIIGRYITSREAPLIGLFNELRTGKDWIGDDIKAHQAILDKITPEILQTMYDTMEEDGTLEEMYQAVIKRAPGIAASGVASMLSVGGQTFKDSPFKKRTALKNRVAQEAHGKDFIDLTPRQRKSLSRKNKEAFAAADEEVKKEPKKVSDFIAKKQERERKDGAFVTGKLSQANQALLAENGIALSVSRTQQKTRLNDKDFGAFRLLLVAELNKRLTGRKTRVAERVRDAKKRALRLLFQDR